VLWSRRLGGIDLNRSDPSRIAENVNAGGGLHPPRGSLQLPVKRYGSETLVLSPELEMVKVPAEATGV
jgi:hypothetical protein